MTTKTIIHEESHVPVYLQSGDSIVYTVTDKAGVTVTHEESITEAVMFNNVIMYSADEEFGMKNVRGLVIGEK